ncbi:MAG: sodium:proton antiporter [Candidatus Kapaibacterium sp.]
MEHGNDIPLYTLAPFVLMLGAIAVLPLVAHRFWESNRNKLIISLVLGIPTGAWMLANGFLHEVEHAMIFDYVPFIILLGGLFVITGGIYVKTNLKSTPIVNSSILAIGAILASFMGTTGAAMLLIRPLMNTNRDRKYKVHTVLFFIATVANCGGLLTPLGDPPLFMMYLRGAPFEWFMQLFPEWLALNLVVIIIYYFVDKYLSGKEGWEIATDVKVSISLEGKQNFIFLAGVVLSVAFINQNTMPFLNINPYLAYIREAVILLMALLSLKFTSQMTRANNHFSWEPIEEVAYLFLGIFLTMIPCLTFLEMHAGDLGVDSPLKVYYFTGFLSSFLDNTPTAVTFYSLVKGLVGLNPEMIAGVETVAGIPEAYMKAISVASVFFGAMTYIGNGPNFMVKAIAESEGIRMPDFFSYMIKFSLIVLLPIFVIVELLFI